MNFKRIFHSATVCIFTLSCILSAEAFLLAQGSGSIWFPQATTFSLTEKFNPILLKGLKIDPDNPFSFEFILDRGHSDLRADDLIPESDKLIRYFMAALTIPESDIWVNLSPFEPDRIAPKVLRATDMGRDLLAQDYVLKRLSASLLHPDSDWGRKFWDQVYKQAYSQFGTTQIPVDAFNKIWIVPRRAVVHQFSQGAFIQESDLEVMLESDYLALVGHKENREFMASKKSEKGDFEILNLEHSADAELAISDITTSIMKEIIVPLLDKEVNYGFHFAPLRQIYSAIILAAWYKTALSETILNRAYSNQEKVLGIEIQDQGVFQKIYEQYLKAFDQQASAKVRVEYDPFDQKHIARKYFSGGASMAVTEHLVVKKVTQEPSSDDPRVSVDFAQATTTPEEKLTTETLTRLKQQIAGTPSSGVKAIVNTDTQEVYFFPNHQRHLDTMKNQGWRPTPPYKNVFGFEIQITAEGSVRAIQINWRGALDQITDGSLIEKATELLLSNIEVSLDIDVILISNSIQQEVQGDQEDRSIDFNLLRVENYSFRAMPSQPVTRIFKEKPQLMQRFLNEFVALNPIDLEDRSQVHKLERFYSYWLLMAFLEENRDVGQHESAILIEGSRSALINHMQGQKSMGDSLAENKITSGDLEILGVVSSFNVNKFVSDFSFMLYTYAILYGDGKNIKDYTHDIRGKAPAFSQFQTIFEDFVDVNTMVPQDFLGRVLFPRFLTDLVVYRYEHKTLALYDDGRQEVIFLRDFDMGEALDPKQKEEIARFILRRRGPFVVLRLSSEDLGYLSDAANVKEIDPVAIINFAMDLGEKEAGLLTNQAREVASQAIFTSQKDGHSLSEGIMVDQNKIKKETISFNGQNVLISWFPGEREKSPELGEIFSESFKQVAALISQENRGEPAPSDSIRDNAQAVGGIDFDARDIFEIVRHGDQQAFVFSDEFLSSIIIGLTPVILDIIDP